MMTTSTAAGYESDISGLICAFRFTPDGSGAELDPQTLEQRLADSANESEEGDFLWLHMNLSQAGCALAAGASGTAGRLHRHAGRGGPFDAHRAAGARAGAVFNDVIFDFERTPAQVATLWVCARRKLLVTLRHKPCARWTGCASMCAGASASVRRPSAGAPDAGSGRPDDRDRAQGQPGCGRDRGPLPGRAVGTGAGGPGGNAPGAGAAAAHAGPSRARSSACWRAAGLAAAARRAGAAESTENSPSCWATWRA